MKKSFRCLTMVMFSFLLIVTACSKEESITPTPPAPLIPPAPPSPPTARAGNDTTMYQPFSTYNLNGSASKDPDGKIVSYAWRLAAGPSSVSIDNDNKKKAYVMGLVEAGIYEFELTVIDSDNLYAQDTIKITIAKPPCTSSNQEVILKDLPWNYSWIMEIDIYDIFSYLPANSFVTNLYIKRDSSDNWEPVIPMDYNSVDYGVKHEWAYGNGILVIFPGENMTDDTPDVKIEYCN